MKPARTIDQRKAQQVAYDSGRECGEREVRCKLPASMLIKQYLKSPPDSFIYAFAAGYLSAWEANKGQGNG